MHGLRFEYERLDEKTVNVTVFAEDDHGRTWKSQPMMVLDVPRGAPADHPAWIIAENAAVKHLRERIG